MRHTKSYFHNALRNTEVSGNQRHLVAPIIFCRSIYNNDGFVPYDFMNSQSSFGIRRIPSDRKIKGRFQTALLKEFQAAPIIIFSFHMMDFMI